MASNSATTAPLQAAAGTLLTVGAGMEFATLNDACKAAVAGDTIAVQAGTYVNDFVNTTCALRIVAVGGLVNEVATVEPPNGKALLTANANLSIQGFTFTGGSDGSPDGNVAGIRLQGANLNISYCYFHDMEEGVLAGTNPTGMITVDHSEFARNGSGDGYSHNIYAGAIASLTITNSYFTASNVGHEIKSRAAITNISNNVIADGPTGTGSYDIDLPNGGVATITNNIIEKGPLSSNVYAIHYSGENQFTYAKNALTVTGNTIINDAGPNGLAVLNQDYANNLDVEARISHNSFYGYAPGRLLSGHGTLTADTTLTHEPVITAPITYTALPLLSLAAGPQLLDLSNSNHTVNGGVAHLTVIDNGGSNTIDGGAGGINVTDTAGWDTISTAAGASDAIILANRNAVLFSAGNDHIAAPGYYEDITATGASTITGSAFNSYTLDGAEKLTASGSGIIAVGAAAAAGITITGGDFSFTELAGGHAAISNQTAAAPPGDSMATVTGAATGELSHAGAISLTLGDSGASVHAGGGSVSIVCGAGADELSAGASAALFDLGSGTDHVWFGTGNATVNAGSGTDTYVFVAGNHGSDTINGFRPGQDTLVFKGFSGIAISAGAVEGGSTVVTLADGTSITFAGIALPGYSAPATTVAPPAPPGAPAAPPAPVVSNGTVVLASGGHVLAGGAPLLTVQDLAGGNSVAGGAGGLALAAADRDVVGTQAGSSNQLTLCRYDTLTGAGTDHVTVAGYANQIAEAGTATVMLGGGNNLVLGGAGMLTVGDAVGGDSITGGAGGLAASLSGGYDTVATAQNATDTINLAGSSVLLSQGTDRISLSGYYNQVTATGAATITAGAGENSYVLDGADSLTSAGSGLVTVGGAAHATIASAGVDNLTIAKLAGGAATVSESLPGGLASLNVTGGAATISAAVGSYGGLSAMLGAGDSVTAGTGNVTLTGGAGQDYFGGGSGSALITLGADDTVSLGAGQLTVQGGTSDTFVVPQGASGTLVIDNWSATDSLVSPGHAAPAILSSTVSGGSDWLNFASGAQVELVGITHLT